MPPPLIELNGEGGPYIERVYGRFLDSVVTPVRYLNGKRVSCPRLPEYDGKHHSFWHCVSEGANEADRKIDLRRCERIEWIGWAIENAGTDKILQWQNERHNKQRRLLLHVPESYLVVLDERRDFHMLVTHYVLDDRRLRKQIAEHEAYKAQKSRSRP